VVDFKSVFGITKLQLDAFQTLTRTVKRQHGVISAIDARQN